jgi:putative ABC transport system permease protein
MLTLFGYVLKNLGRQKLRTALAAVGMTVGVWLVVVFSAISAGALQTVESMLTAFGEDFHCYKAGIADMALSSLPEKETRAAILEVDGVAETSSVLWWLSKTEGAEWVFIAGLRPGEFALSKLLKNGTGGFSAPDAREAIVGGLRLATLKKKVGDTIEFEGKAYLITGRFVRGMPLYDNAVVLPFDVVQADFRQGDDSANFIAVRTQKGADRVAVAKAVETALPGLSTVSTLDEVAKVDQGLKKMRTMSYVILVTAIFIGFLFVMLAMVMVIFERIREIGILRAVGWPRRKIVFVVLMEALLLSVAGVVVGIPTGLLGVEIISRVTELDAFLAPVYDATMFLRVILVSVIAATIGGIYPAWRAARLHPVQAIRYE